MPLFFLLVLASCLGGVKNSGKVRGYEPGRVLMKKSFYEVGEVSSDWQLFKLQSATVAFYHQDSGSTMATAAFCDQAYNDSPLKMLTKHLFPGLQNLEISHQESFSIDHREALRTWASAKLDGVRVDLDLVVIKKDACLFDFFLIHQGSLPVEIQREVRKDFEEFFKGFVFRGFL
ncbi:MAG: hypothetical protein KDK66_09115 [Deltaproteobacteria bacterium]|nr:hypothetical protein [Deltaproteobacteria bacterium]